MKNKKSIYIVITILIIIFIILINVSSKKEDKADYSNNKFPEEQNIIIENNVDEDENKNIIQNQTIESNKKSNTQVIKDEESKSQVNAENKQEKNDYNMQSEKISSTFDENAFIDGHLKEYPGFGEQYATLKINKIGVNAPIFFGATDETVLKGVGHDSGSYFSGENGTIIMCEHNYMNNFKRLGALVNGDIVEVQTGYGDFYYKIYDEQIVLETEKNKLPIQHNEEILMLYTCYPSNNTGHTPYRYVIYAKKI